MKELLKKIIFTLFPNNHIVFESAPVYADNTRAVFDEMVRRGMDQKYTFYWYCPPNVHCPDQIAHAGLLEFPGKTPFQKWKTRFIMLTARALISCNDVLCASCPGQYAICLMHGAPLKSVKGFYEIPKKLDDILSFSSYLAPIEEECSGAEQSKMRFLGFPRNDILFGSTLDTHTLFPNADYDKLIYWMPTYRQHKNGNLDISSIAMPILYNEEIAQKVNEAAQKAGVLVVVKPHFAQDVSRITTLNLSNLVFINDGFLSEHSIINYELLGKADALLTDYSSVYYDYLLTDRPIGLCWDDFEDFKAREGFAVDMDTVLAGGEKIYTPEDLCGFIARIAAGEDTLQASRAKVKQLIHDHPDCHATQRVVDWIQQKLER